MVKNLLYKSIFAFCLITISAITLAQVDTVFWYAAPDYTSDHGEGPLYFRVAGQGQAANVSVTMPATGTLIYSGSVTANGFIDIPLSVALVETTPGVTNRGLKVSSDNPISVYYDLDHGYNREMTSLKGNNALGTEFYATFQNIWYNDTAPSSQDGDSRFFPYPRSGVRIVATEDGTVVTIYPPKSVLDGSSPACVTTSPVVSPVLSKGQVWGIDACYFAGRGHLGGMRITTNNKPVAVTEFDDSMFKKYTNPASNGGCRDAAGDQIVPTNVIGLNYIVMRGQLDTDPWGTGENAFVTATVDGTEIFADGISLGIINAGETKRVPIPYTVGKTSTWIRGTNAVYVLHATGFQCELGEALLPTTDGCTGSYKVQIYRSKTDPFYLYLMTRDIKNGPAGFTITTATRTFNLNPAMFEPAGAGGSGWHIAKILFKDSKATDTVPMGSVVTVTNSNDVFHLGNISGSAGQSAKYAYFSDYTVTNPAATVYTSKYGDIARTCSMQPIQLYSDGGLKYKWIAESDPGDLVYLSDPDSQYPIFYPPGQGNYKYGVIISRSCFLDDTLHITISIFQQSKARFTLDDWKGCSPFSPIFADSSINADPAYYHWDFGDGTHSYVYSGTFTHNYPANNTDTVQIYNAALNVESSDNCPSRYERRIAVKPFIEASFTPDTVGCQPFDITFNNTSTGNLTDTSYFWKISDGVQDFQRIHTHHFENNGSSDRVDTVMLIVTSPYFCRDTATRLVTVHPRIEADFAIDTVSKCSPINVKITPLAIGVDTFFWTLGTENYITTSNAPILRTYQNTTSPTPITVPILLTAKNDEGCYKTAQGQLTVYPEVHASFNPDNLAGCDSTLINFTNTSTGYNLLYRWDFGDGTSSTDQHVSKYFVNKATDSLVYNVRLKTISSLYQCSDTVSIPITIYPFVESNFTFFNTSSCAPINLQLINSSIGGSQYTWIFDDGTVNYVTSDPSAFSHIFNNTGTTVNTYNIQLIAQNGHNCSDTLKRPLMVYPQITAAFLPNVDRGCNPLTVTNFNNTSGPLVKTYSWDFGDGTSSNLQNPSHIFNNDSSGSKVFPINLTVISDYNCVSSTSIPVQVYSFIEAGFTVDKAVGCAPLEVYITNTARGGISGGTWNYSCSPGSQTFQMGVSPGIKRFENNNNYNLPCIITLTVNNADGCVSSYKDTVTIYPQVIADFSTNVSEGCNPLDVRFSYGASNVPNRYQWEFGDGSSSTTFNKAIFTKRFTNIPGITLDTFPVTLYAYSSQGCWDTIKRNIIVYPYVDANFTFPDADGCSGHEIKITNNSKPVTGRNNYWTFGDPGSSTNVLNNLPSLSHIYDNTTNPNSAIYNCRLIVAYNRNGTDRCHDTLSRLVTIFPEVTASFTPSPAEICYGTGLITFLNNSTIGNNSPANLLRFNWAFGDNGTAYATSTASQSHGYNNFTYDDVAYTVTLNATSDKYPECINTTTRTVIIHPKPVASIRASSYNSCPPFDLTVNNISKVDSSTYYWNFGDGSAMETTTTLAPVIHRYDHWTDVTQNYTLRMRAVTEHGCVDSTSQSVTVYPRVIADFLPHDAAGCSQPLIVPFINKTTRASSYIWDFGDNTGIRVKDPLHQFFNNTTDIITDTVTLIGISDYKCTDTVKWPVTIYPQPVAKFTALPTHQTFPDRTVRVFNETNPGYWHYTWNFGDGRTLLTDSKDDTINMYSTWGAYNVQLTAKSDYCEDSVTQRIRIFPPMVIADFTMDTTSGCVPLPVVFTDMSIYGGNRKWDFDNGQESSDSVTPPIIFEKPGKYQVKLQETGPGGIAYTYKTVEAYALPEVAFQYTPSTVMLGDAVKFNNTTKYGSRYLWDFGDSTYSAEAEPTHTYKAVGIYTVKLTSWTDHDCVDSVVKVRAIEVIGAGLLWFPNAFTPNTSGENDGRYTLPPDVDLLNEVFHPYYDGVLEYHLEIYDRWGEKLWETDDIEIGWNGYYKGKLCKTDVYVWKAKGKFENGKTFDKAGNVTLLR